jgi:hypothetical protein
MTCPTCYWTDEPVVTGADRQSLFVAQRSFCAIRAASPSWRETVRAAVAGEEPDPAWRTLVGADDPAAPTPREHAAAKLVKRIEHAFAGVAPAGRTSLREAYRADYYTEPGDLDWRDDDTDWRRIPPYVLEYFDQRTSVFTFGNLDSFRYYMPAYMRQALRAGPGIGTTHALDLPLPPGTAPDTLEKVLALTREQREVVVEFLEFVLDYDGPDKAAQRALDRIWRPVTTV